MYPQGGYRNPYSIYGIGDRSQTSRQPSRPSAPTSQPQPQPQPQPQQQQQIPKPQPQPQQQQQQQIPKPQPQPQQQQQPQIPKPEAKKEEPSKPTQPARVPSKQEPQVPNQARVSATETKKETPTPTPNPPPATAIVKSSTPAQLLNLSASENNKELSIVPVDQGKAIVKGSSSEPKKSLQQGIKEDITSLSRRLAELHAQHKLLNGDQRPMAGQSDLGVRVITLAGENRGATMDLGSESRNNAIYDSQEEGHKDGTVNEKDANGKGAQSPSVASPMFAYVNSNVQAANNSLLYHSSCAHRDPGVHLGLSNTPFHAPKESAALKETRAKLKAVKDSA